METKFEQLRRRAHEAPTAMWPGEKEVLLQLLLDEVDRLEKVINNLENEKWEEAI